MANAWAGGPAFEFLKLAQLWVPLDKNEGCVKQKLSLTMWKHR